MRLIFSSATKCAQLAQSGDVMSQQCTATRHQQREHTQGKEKTGEAGYNQMSTANEKQHQARHGSKKPEAAFGD